MKPVITKRSEEDIKKTWNSIGDMGRELGFKPIKYYCEGHGERGSGVTPEDAYQDWYFKMVTENKENIIQDQESDKSIWHVISMFFKRVFKNGR